MTGSGGDAGVAVDRRTGGQAAGAHDGPLAGGAALDLAQQPAPVRLLDGWPGLVEYRDPPDFSRNTDAARTTPATGTPASSAPSPAASIPRSAALFDGRNPTSTPGHPEGPGHAGHVDALAPRVAKAGPVRWTEPGTMTSSGIVRSIVKFGLTISMTPPAGGWGDRCSDA